MTKLSMTKKLSTTSSQASPVKEESDGTTELLILSYVVSRTALWLSVEEAGCLRTTPIEQGRSYVPFEDVSSFLVL